MMLIIIKLIIEDVKSYNKLIILTLKKVVIIQLIMKKLSVLN